MSEPIIRHVKPVDYQPIIIVVDEWWGGRQMADMLPKLFFVHFANTSFIAERDGKIVGFVIGFVSQVVPEEAYIHFVGVHPDFRKGGLGQALYNRFFSAVTAFSCHTIRCVTSPINKGSIAFHLRMGFCADDIPVFEDYDGKDEDRVLFSKSLIRTTVTRSIPR